MAAFVKKLVEKASSKKTEGLSATLKPDDIEPRLVFHYGIPPASLLLEYNSIRQILAIATKDGRIKLFGKDGSQALLESSETAPSKILLFMDSQGVLVNVNVHNHIEVWDIDTKCLSTVHRHEKEITSICATQHAPYLYIGDSAGHISVLRVDQEQWSIEQMKYHIPLSASHEKSIEVESEIAVKYILPQPTAETKRVLIIHCDGVITLWAIQESTVIFTSVSTILPSLYQETKKVTAACWASTAGTKVAVGYSNGDILLWSVPRQSDSKTEQVSINETGVGQITLVCKLNLGYKADKTPISKLKWIGADGKSSRLYVLGIPENFSANLQVVLLDEHTESRTTKLTLNPPESLIDLEIITSSIEHKRHDSLLLLGKSSHIYTYDDCLIERYLVQCQNKSSPSLPKEQMIKLPYGDSTITVTKFMTSLPSMPCSSDEEFNMVAKNKLPLFPFERKLKAEGNSNSMTFSPLTRAKNLFITGHDNGTINFWNASCPLFLQVASITQQSDDNFSVSGCALTALHFDIESHTLVSGDQSGMVRIYVFKSEIFAPQSSFVSFQGMSKKGSNHIVNRVKLVKVNGSVLSINMTENLKQLAVGTDQGYVSLVDLEGPTILYQRLIVSEFSKGIISIHFETCSFHGFEKNVLLVATNDSSVLALECDSGNTLSSSMVRPKKPSRALYTWILDVHGISNNIISNNTMAKQLVLLCSEKAVYVYSLSHLVQGVKKVLYKKKFNSSCYWASTFGSSDGLVLLFTSGKIEIRSLPDLSLAKESSIRGFTFSTLKSPPTLDIIVSSSQDGELIIVNGNQELLFVSTLLHKEAYRLLDSVTQVFNRNLGYSQQGCNSISSAPLEEKKKGIFGSLVKDNNGTKSKTRFEVESQDSRRSIEELSTIFSKTNFAIQSETETKVTMNEEDVELDIDDIDIEDVKEKPKGYPVVAGLNKLNITNKFQAIKGKLKYAKVKNDKVPVHNEPQDEKTGAIDQIKKKYGYSSSSESSVANISRSKLSENMRKLQGIKTKTTEMQDTAQSFNSMAREVLRFAENDKKGGS